MGLLSAVRSSVRRFRRYVVPTGSMLIVAAANLLAQDQPLLPLPDSAPVTRVSNASLKVQPAGIEEILEPEEYYLRHRAPLPLQIGSSDLQLSSQALDAAATQPTYGPPTISNLRERTDRLISLDETLAIALKNSEVIRVLAGNLAVSSGRTIYDPAIANATIDSERARFDPILIINNNWSQNESPNAFPNALVPTLTDIDGTKTDSYLLNSSLTKLNTLGGQSALSFGNTNQRFFPGLFPLSPQNRYSTEVSYTQPLLRGAGQLANRAPIVIAEIETNRSFFQFRNSIQSLVRGTINAYWSLVFSRTDLWARKIQVEQAEEALKRSTSRKNAGLADISEVAQARAALARFRASLIAAESNVLQSEASLQNILGLSPVELERLIPSTTPTTDQIEFDWNRVLALAKERRPDLIELQLILEADQQRLAIARNQMKPQVDAVALYRWNGLEGETPAGTRTASRGDQFTDWTLGVNFSVPLLLRQERANVRSSELLLARDRANLQQGLHNAEHVLALNLRNIAQFYAQYVAFTEAREAAKENLEQQFANFGAGRVVFLNVLQAITDWGNAVSQQAQSLAQYNTELASLELESGTILETHGIYFQQDRACSLGPLWWRGVRGSRNYPRSILPQQNAPRYKSGTQPAENSFDLDDYPRARGAK